MKMSGISERNSLICKIKASGLFDEDWYLRTYPDVAASSLDPVEHYLRIGAWLGREPGPDFDTGLYLREHPEVGHLDILPFVHSIIKDDPPEEAVVEIIEVADEAADPVAYSVLPLDEAYYLLHNADVASAGLSARVHFDANGYRELRNPHADFDIWWYTQNYLLGTPDSEVNALAHYNQTGAALGYLPCPPRPVSFDAAHARPLPQNPRRICLFAAYDTDGIVDDYALAYLRDMARHADIYYLADCAMDPAEMAKLDGLVKGAWAERHGMYDFGSWSILARDHVGWDMIEAYDELILANDSCYLVHPLEETFATMAARPCAWWGLQATKGMISTAHQNKILEEAPVSISDIKAHHLDRFETDPLYDFHVGSYFLAFRKDVINDPGFRRVLDNVGEEASKLRIIRKYEIGLTRFLISKGYEFDTLVETVTKQHPIFTERAFDLIDAGFPLLKRYFLTQNHYKVKGLAQWVSRIHQANPDVDVDILEANLNRVGDAFKLYNNFHIGRDAVMSRAPRSEEEMRSEDLKTPKYDHWWAFPVCSYSHLFSDNTRALFERVKNDPAIKKIILTRSAHIKVEGVNVVIVPLHSYEGQSYLLRARQVFLRHGVRSNVGYPLSSDLHNFHNLWHGIPLKRIGYASLDQAETLKDQEVQNKRLRSVIASSDVDHLAMTAAYWPLNFHDIWVTGLPRHDIILAPEDQLPKDFAPRTQRLKDRLQGRKFMLFAPTFRADQANGYYSFSDAEVQQLANWLNANNIVMGIREHMADTTRLYSSQLLGNCFFDVSERHYPDIELLYRHADMLLTDYSSCFIDFMLTGRPMASFAFDHDSYADTQRGLFYDQKMVFPGPVCYTFTELMTGLEKLIETPTQAELQAYDWKVSFFHKYRDCFNSDRVVARVKETYSGSKLLWEKTAPLPDSATRTATFVYSPTHNSTNRHRIFNLVEHLRDLGWTCRVVSEGQLKPAALQSADVMFICRIPMSESLRDFCETFHVGGGRIVFDTDDLIHDIEAFSQSEYFRQSPEFASDYKVLSVRTQQMIERADLVTATTSALAENLAGTGKRVKVVPNSISAALFAKFSAPTAPRNEDGKIHLCYLSGDALHSEDFAQCRTALMRVLARHSQVKLHVIGASDQPETAAASSDALIDHINYGPMPYEALHEFITGMDINLAPLAPSLFNDCKSEMNIVDAALHRVPTVASPTRSYINTIIDGKNGMLAQSAQAWEAALERLISDADLRRKLGHAAFETIVPKFSAPSSARLLAAEINEMLRPETPSRKLG